MELIDCHAHLYPPQFSQQSLNAALSAAEAASLSAIITLPETLSDCAQVLQLSRQHAIIKPCAGISNSRIYIKRV